MASPTRLPTATPLAAPSELPRQSLTAPDARAAPASVAAERAGDALDLHFAGRWGIDQPAPDLRAMHAALAAKPSLVRLRADALGEWDSLLVATLWRIVADARSRDVQVDDTALPAPLRAVLAMAALPPSPQPIAPPPRGLARLGNAALAGTRSALATLRFVGEILASLARLATGRARMRGADLVWQLEQAGPRSLPIVALITFLVGLILAYMGAAQLALFGAQVYIADLVSIGMVREIAALMTAIILAGRVGAAYAAELGTMQVNEEIDALVTMGISPVDHLVLPRLLAITLMAPLLVACGATMGVLAGLLTALVVFDVPALQFVQQSIDALSLAHLSVGLVKGTAYALLVALAGCQQGLQAGRNAQAVGEATTRAVVKAIVWIVVWASLLTIAFQRLGI